MFFTPAVNAARGIAYQINAAITQFFTNFYTAVRPQITKYYAQGDMTEMTKLVFRSSKMSFYLILLVSMPIIIETPYIVNLWLGQLPEYVVPFTRLIIAISAIDSMATPPNDGSPCHRKHPSLPIVSGNNDHAKHPDFIPVFKMGILADGCFLRFIVHIHRVPFHALVDCAQTNGIPCKRIHHKSIWLIPAGMCHRVGHTIIGIYTHAGRHLQRITDMYTLYCIKHRNNLLHRLKCTRAPVCIGNYQKRKILHKQ